MKEFKVILLGKEYCGKTSLIDRFVHDRFHGPKFYRNTIGAAFQSKEIKCNGKSVLLGIWDTAGCERYESMARLYYRNAAAAIVCFDVSDASSLQKVDFWIQELRKSKDDAKIYICACKSDLALMDDQKPPLNSNEINDLGETYHAKVFETSAKTGHNVQELFKCVVRDYLQDPVNSLTSFQNLSEDRDQARKCCILL